MFRKKQGLGYIQDKKDTRDHSIDNVPTLKAISAVESPPKSIIPNESFSPIKNQLQIGACTAFAATALMEYYIKRTTGKNYDLSEKFLYWVTRKLLGWEGKDSGAYLRTVMQALTRFGICEEKFAPYDQKFTEMPDWTHGALADDFKAETYMRIDTPDRTNQQVLDKIKALIFRKYPIQFGFSVFKNTMDRRTGDIYIPGKNTKQTGGHAVVITGYDDDKHIKDMDGNVHRGALKIRNSWGKSWGDEGYGWLPYWYVLNGHANDFWLMFRADWIKLERFE